MGDNSLGQLGIGSNKNSLVPIKNVMLDTFKIIKISASKISGAISEKGEIFVWGNNPQGDYLFPQKIGEINFIKDIKMGDNFAIISDNEGFVYKWGDLEKENCLFPKPIKFLSDKNIEFIDSNSKFAIAITNDNNNICLKSYFYLILIIIFYLLNNLKFDILN